MTPDSRLVAVAAVAVAVLLAGCGGSGQSAPRAARSADEIAGAIRQALQRTDERTFDDALATTCSSLEVFSSDPAQALVEILEAQAQTRDTELGETLLQAEPSLPRWVGSAAEGLGDAQDVGEVVTALGCSN